MHDKNVGQSVQPPPPDPKKKKASVVWTESKATFRQKIMNKVAGFILMRRR